MREKCDGVMSATGKEPLEKGKNVEYDMLLVEDKEGVEKMREICSKGVIIVCAYSVYCPASRKWIQEKFIPEAGTHFPNVPVMVVGTGTEARELVLPGVTSFTPDEGKKFSMELQEKCPSVRAHVECSPVTFQVCFFYFIFYFLFFIFYFFIFLFFILNSLFYFLLLLLYSFFFPHSPFKRDSEPWPTWVFPFA